MVQAVSKTLVMKKNKKKIFNFLIIFLKKLIIESAHFVMKREKIRLFCLFLLKPFPFIDRKLRYLVDNQQSLENEIFEDIYGYTKYSEESYRIPVNNLALRGKKIFQELYYLSSANNDKGCD